ncbi:MAG: thioredoxin family protein [Bacteroidales bacterium]|nr:thioredoxin family protein [Bacteroidales bacterium]
MKIIEIASHVDLLKNIEGKEKAYLLLIKKGSEQSDCSLNNLTEVANNSTNIDMYIADVNKVKDIHEVYSITTVPTMLEFEKGKFVNTLKGCHKPDFYRSFFENAVFTPSGSGDKPQKSVTVYTTPACSWCKTIKTHLKNHGIRYREVDVSRNQNAAEEMQRKSGQMGVPQTDIGGEIVVGFDKQKINRLLEINQ